MELHTYSSLNKDFLHEYAHSMDEADEAIVFFSPTIVALKKLPTIDENDIRKGFERENIMVLSDKNELENILLSKDWTDKNLLMMSSGNFDGLDLKALSEKIV
jgi:UDP-N-acetylmuramate: L-alanyl-gamma-D-glutamyl-meso-diaminopimelate ligase